MKELIDLVDSTGRIIKTGVERGDNMKLGSLHVQVAIAVVLNNSGEVIVHKRSNYKKVNPGYIDHVCGAIVSGESPETTAFREAKEEIGIELENLRLIRQGLNEYNTYSYLFVGQSNKLPKIETPNEVQWVGILSKEELLSLKSSKKENFVDGFFEDLELAIATKMS